MRQILCFIILTFFITVPAAFADTAVAHLEATQNGLKIDGVIHFEETPQGLKIEAEVHDAPDGWHGFHIHANGSCDEQGKAAGGHFNPDQHPHGDVQKQGAENVHPGDLGNIEIKDGRGNLEATVPHLTLREGKYAVLGKAVILHEKEDDFNQPNGNAGDRIACGVIEAQ